MEPNINHINEMHIMAQANQAQLSICPFTWRHISAWKCVSDSLSPNKKGPYLWLSVSCESVCGQGVVHRHMSLPLAVRLCGVKYSVLWSSLCTLKLTNWITLIPVKSLMAYEIPFFGDNKGSKLPNQYQKLTSKLALIIDAMTVTACKDADSLRMKKWDFKSARSPLDT